uniref:Uncharacterized protein n=1 Tax=Mesocestoides corti TaxID=53468 RepID=A0A5K3FGU7_MESCO
MPLELRETQDWLRPGGPTCLRPKPTPHHITHVQGFPVFKSAQLGVLCPYALKRC